MLKLANVLLQYMCQESLLVLNACMVSVLTVMFACKLGIKVLI